MKKKTLLSLAVLCILALSSCKKEKTDPTPVTPPDLTPKITGISPTSAHYGELVTITGSNFGVNPVDNTVKVNGVAIPVQQASATSLTIKLPSMLASGGGSVEVTTAKGAVTGPQLTYVPDVFISGSVNTSSNVTIARYWKNDTAVNLSNGGSDASTAGIVVRGDSIYTAGIIYNTRSNPVYWFNNIEQALQTPVEGSAINGIAVSGSDVYTAGYDNTNISLGRYWRNGVAVSLGNQQIPNAIAIAGTDVISVGLRPGATNSKAAYWRNGTATDLTDGTSYGEATCVAVSGTDIYIAGIQNIGGTERARVWVNGTGTTLSNSANNSRAHAIAVSGSNVYVAGVELMPSGNTAARYWKNGVETALTDGSTYLRISGIAVYKDDVYVTGHEQINGIMKPVYWKNGTKVVLPSGGFTGYTSGICLR